MIARQGHAGDQQLEGAEKEVSGHRGGEQLQWNGLCGLASVPTPPWSIQRHAPGLLQPLHHHQVCPARPVEEDDRSSASETTSHLF